MHSVILLDIVNLIHCVILLICSDIYQLQSNDAKRQEWSGVFVG